VKLHLESYRQFIWNWYKGKCCRIGFKLKSNEQCRLVPSSQGSQWLQSWLPTQHSVTVRGAIPPLRRVLKVNKLQPAKQHCVTVGMSSHTCQ